MRNFWILFSFATLAVISHESQARVAADRSPWHWALCAYRESRHAIGMAVRMPGMSPKEPSVVKLLGNACQKTDQLVHVDRKEKLIKDAIQMFISANNPLTTSSGQTQLNIFFENACGKKFKVHVQRGLEAGMAYTPSAEEQSEMLAKCRVGISGLNCADKIKNRLLLKDGSLVDVLRDENTRQNSATLRLAGSSSDIDLCAPEREPRSNSHNFKIIGYNGHQGVEETDK